MDAMAPDDRHPGGHEPAEHEEHDDERQRERDALAGRRSVSIWWVMASTSGRTPPTAPVAPGNAATMASNCCCAAACAAFRCSVSSPLANAATVTKPPPAGLPPRRNAADSRVLQAAGQEERRRHRGDVRGCWPARWLAVVAAATAAGSARFGPGHLQGEAVRAGLVGPDEVLAGLGLARRRRRPGVQALEERLPGHPAHGDGERRRGDDHPHEHEPPRVPGPHGAQPGQARPRVCLGRRPPGSPSAGAGSTAVAAREGRRARWPRLSVRGRRPSPPAH